ncbi:hypothetical protein AB0O07_22680 [Streptomyces sp. NPDC093085]|uniref:hypothetical protein n=1 Tax=Streptomyces sp. NPDC093085 TaxID=3155068 RepID=UPI003437A037
MPTNQDHPQPAENPFSKKTRRRTTPTTLTLLPKAQDSLITTTRLAELGVSAATVRRRCRPGGQWQRVLPRVVLLQTGPPSARQRLRAALLNAGEGAMLTGLAALGLYGVRAAGRSGSPGPVDVLVTGGRRPQNTSFVRIRTTRRPVSVLPVQRLPCARLPRAVADAVPHLRSGPEVTALLTEVVQRGRCTLPDLRTELRITRALRNPRVTETLEGLTAGVRSVEEAEARHLLRDAGIPDPLWNEPLFYPDGTFLARPDAHWPEVSVVLEIDSRQWHLSPGDWERTMTRRNLMTSQGYLVLSVSPTQLRADPRSFLTLLHTTLTRAKNHPPPTTTATPSPHPTPRRRGTPSRPRTTGRTSVTRSRARSAGSSPPTRMDTNSPRRTPHSTTRHESAASGGD